MNKKHLLFFLLVLGIPIVALVVKVVETPSQQSISREFVADFSDDRVLVGIAEHVFLAKVLERTGDQEMSGTPASQFLAEVFLVPSS